VNHTEKLTSGDMPDLRIHHYVAAGVLLSALVLYFSTVAPTTSFWDCGEFIACSFSMGVPHPPGAPFFLLIGRVFSMLPFHPDVGFRVNAISALVSALSVLFAYLIVVRLIRRWRGPEHKVADKVLVYGSSAIGALAFAASHSQWFNAVEAEVYAISMLFTALVVWLAVKWMDNSEKKSSLKYLLLIAYIVGLSTGVHLLNILALCPIVLLIYFQKYEFTWKGFWVAFGASFLAILIVYPGIVAGIPNLIEKGMFALVFAVLVCLGIFIWAVYNRHNVIALLFSSVLLVMVGYSTYTVIYIRSNQKPEINENQPDTVENLISYLNREQYGSSGPIEMQNLSVSIGERVQRNGGKFIRLTPNKVIRFNIFERKAPVWEYQIKKMYLRYLSWQFFIGERGQPFIFPFVFAAIGLYWHFRRDHKRAFGIFMLFVMTGFAILAYLNQDDPQPRERDYAYVGSYFAVALWIGMGVVALFETVEDYLKNKGEKVRKLFAYGMVGLCGALIPLNMIIQGYHSHDRKGNFVAWDYSHNMLETCEPNSIIFTNGDNDTFPLWYLQVVEGIRRDVRVVNLSLLNTDWYIKQLRDMEPKVPISLSDQFIDEKLCGRTDQALLMRYWPPGKQEWSISTPDSRQMTWKVPATMFINTGQPGEKRGTNNFLRVQDIMILHILEEAKWERPVYFAVTVSSSNLIGLKPFMLMDGLAFSVHPKKQRREINEKLMRKHLFETYRDNYRNLDNPDVFLYPNVLKLLQNYRSGFLQLVYNYYSKARTPAQKAPSGVPEEEWKERFEELSAYEKAQYTLLLMDEVIPEEVIPLTNREILLQMGRIYSEVGRPAEAVKRFERSLSLPGTTMNDKLQAAYYIFEYSEDKELGKQLMEETLGENPTVDQLLNIAAIYDQSKMEDELSEILDRISAMPGLTNQQQINLATYYFEQKKYEEAKSIYKALAATNPNDGAAKGGLLQVYTALNDTPNAVALLKDWVMQNPRDKKAADQLKDWTK